MVYNLQICQVQCDFETLFPKDSKQPFIIKMHIYSQNCGINLDVDLLENPLYVLYVLIRPNRTDKSMGTPATSFIRFSAQGLRAEFVWNK